MFLCKTSVKYFFVKIKIFQKWIAKVVEKLLKRKLQNKFKNDITLNVSFYIIPILLSISKGC
jgi:hypothetical protein